MSGSYRVNAGGKYLASSGRWLFDVGQALTFNSVADAEGAIARWGRYCSGSIRPKVEPAR